MGTIHNSSLILHPFPLPGAFPQAPSWRREARPTTEWGLQQNRRKVSLGTRPEGFRSMYLMAKYYVFCTVILIIRW